MIEARDLPQEYRDMAQRYMNHNVKVAADGEAHALKDYRYLEGFVFVSESNGQAWRVKKDFPEDDQVFLATLDNKHQLLASREVKFKLP